MGQNHLSTSCPCRLLLSTSSFQLLPSNFSRPTLPSHFCVVITPAHSRPVTGTICVSPFARAHGCDRTLLRTRRPIRPFERARKRLVCGTWVAPRRGPCRHVDNFAFMRATRRR